MKRIILLAIIALSILASGATVSAAYCGDGIIQAPNDAGFYEQCDEGSANGVVCTPEPGETCSYCTSSCTVRTITGPTLPDPTYCGDGIVQKPNDDGIYEQCDEGTNNKLPGQVSAPYGESVSFCHAQTCEVSTKHGGFCGDGICQSGFENAFTCPQDCATGTPGPSLSVDLWANPTRANAPATVTYHCAAAFGKQPYTFTVNFGDGSAPRTVSGTGITGTHTYETPGSYTMRCTVVDADGTSRSDTELIDVVAPKLSSALDVWPTQGEAPLYSAYACSGAGGVAPYSYSISFGDGSSSTSREGTHTFAAGSYEVSCTVTDSIGQTSTSTRNVTALEPVAPVSVSYSVTPSSGVAPLDTAHACSATGGVAPYSYVITTGDGRTISSASASHKYGAGSFTARCTVTDAVGSTASRTVSVSVDEPAPPKDPLSVSLSASPTSGYAPLTVSYSCDVSGGSAPITSRVRFGSQTTSALSGEIEFTNAGSYTIVCDASDADGDSASDSVVVSVDKAPKLSSSFSVNPQSGTAPLDVVYSCVGVNGVPPYTYVIATGDGSSSTSATGSHTYGAGSFTARCTVTDSLGQTSMITRTVKATEPIENLSLVYSVNPSSGFAPLNTAHACSAAGGVAPYSYVIETGDGRTISASSASHTYDVGSFVASCTVTDSRGESASRTRTISVSEYVAPKDPLSVSLSASPTSGLAPLTVNYSCSVSGGRAPVSSSVSFGDGSSSSSLSGTHTFSNAGSYTIVCDASDADGDSASDSVVVSVNKVPKLGSSFSVDPQSGTAPLDVVYSCVGVNGVPPYTYVITTGDGSSSTSATGSHTYGVGVFTASCTVTDSIGQTSTSTRTVTVEEPVLPKDPLEVSLNVTPTVGLAPLTVEYSCSVSGGRAPVSSSVSFGDGASSNVLSGTHTFTNPGTYVVSCQAADVDQDHPVIDSVTVEVFDPDEHLSLTFAAHPKIGVEPLDVRFTCEAFGSPFGFWYTVDRGDESFFGTRSSVDHTYRYESYGVYETSCTAADPLGRSVSSQIIPVIVVPDSSVSISPKDPLSDDDLICRVDAYPNGVFDFSWYREGVLLRNDRGVSSSVLSSALTSGKDTITCIATMPGVDVEIGRDSVTVSEPAPGPYAIDLSVTPDRGIEPLVSVIACEAFGGIDPISYSVIVDGSSITSTGLFEETFLFAQYGVYGVECVASDALGRTVDATTNVVVLPDSSVSITPSDPMPDDSLTCVVDAYPNDPFDFAWYVNGVLAGFNSSVSSSTLPLALSGGETVECVAYLPDTSEEIGSDTVTVGHPAPTGIEFTVTPLSGYAPLDVSYACELLGGFGAATYKIDIDREGTAIASSDEASGEIELSIAGTYSFTCTGTDALGRSLSAQRSVIVTPRDYSGDWSISADPLAGPAPLPVTFTADTSLIPIDGPVEWDFADGHTASGSPRVHTFAKAGEYVVTATARLLDGQVLTRNVTIVVGPREQAPIPVDLSRVQITRAFAEVVGDSVYATVTVKNDAGVTLRGVTATIQLPESGVWAQQRMSDIPHGSSGTTTFFVPIDDVSFETFAIFVVENRDIRLDKGAIVIR